MALLQQIWCPRCQQSKKASHTAAEYPVICDDCRYTEEEQARQEALRAAALGSIEERLVALELAVYRLQRTIDRLPHEVLIG